jgi:hypothetical protein
LRLELLDVLIEKILPDAVEAEPDVNLPVDSVDVEIEE